MSATEARPLRADAQRNRERLLDAAVRAFAQEGPDVTLDAIAKDAGVGIGTLYRHFPTREALVEAAPAPSNVVTAVIRRSRLSEYGFPPEAMTARNASAMSRFVVI